MSIRNVLSIAGAGLLLLIPLAAESSAQTTATITGTISDATGALIPGAEVTAENVNTGISTTQVSNEVGGYLIPSLQPGTYRLSASLPGFQTVTLDNILLSQGQQVRFNLTLQVGATATAVEVVTDSAVAMATTSATIGNVLPDIEVRSLPLASRNVIDLATLSAGTVGDNFGGSRASQINTTRDGLPTGDGRYLDWNGAYSGTFTSPDLIEEVQVNVSSVDAAVGRGSSQVRLQTRSGSNEFHGALFYTNENSALSSNNWFQNLVGADKDYRNRNQFGGRIGGPIVSDKAFFFFLFDGQRYIDKAEHIGRVLTPEARLGNFRYLTSGAPGGTSRRNGNANANTPSVDLQGNVLTSDGGTPLFVNSFNVFDDVSDPFRTQIDPVWYGPEYLTRMPVPNDWTVGDGLNTAGIRWQRTNHGAGSATGNSQLENRDHYTVRIDYQVNDSNRVSFSATQEDNWSVTGQTGLPDWPTGTFGRLAREPDFATASWTSVLSPTVVNEFRWGKKADSWIGEQPILWGCCEAGSVFWNDDNLEPEALIWKSTYPQIQVPATGNYSGGDVLLQVEQDTNLGGDYARVRQGPRWSNSPLWQWADTVSWSRGAHSLQFGFEATWASTSQVDAAGAHPTAILGVGDVPVPGINSTNFPGLNSRDVGLAEDLLANLAGSVEEVEQSFFVQDPSQTDFLSFQDGFMLKEREFHQNDYAGFFKDTWNATSNLTLNYGVRYDIYGTPYEKNGLGVKPIGGQASVLSGGTTIFDLAGKHSPNPDTLIYNNDFNNFAPSFGFSYNVPWFTRATVVRGGYGVNFVGSATFLQYSSAIGSAPGSTLGIDATPASLVPSGYLDITSVQAVFPLPTGGIVPREPIPLTNRSTTIQAYADERSVPYIQNFNLSIQQELAQNLTLDVRYVGSKGTLLRSTRQLNGVNIFDNGFLDAFNVTRAGGDAPLLDAMLDGIKIGSITVGTNGSGSEALRRFGSTDNFIADGEVAEVANFLNTSATGTGERGGLLRTNGFAENFFVLNPQFGNVRFHGNDDNSTYHSLQTSLTRRFTDGFTGEFNYTWSRAIGNSAANNSFGSDTTEETRDPRNRRLQKGLVVFHRTHSFKSHGTWQLPFGPGRAFGSEAPSWVARVVEGWDLSAIFSLTSGQPLSIQSEIETLHDRDEINTPDLVGVLPADLGKVVKGANGVVSYFGGLSQEDAPVPNFGTDPNNLAGDFGNSIIVDNAGNTVFQNPGPGTTGNFGLRAPNIEGPRDFGLDLALQKSIQISEGITFSIRADALNVMNKPLWDNPEIDINDSNFGRVEGADGERSIVINARIDF